MKVVWSSIKLEIFTARQLTAGPVIAALSTSCPRAQMEAWTKKLLHDFTCRPDGHLPVANLIFDQAGNLYGTTLSGGQHGAGMVFELSKNSDGSWTEKRLHDFTIQRGAGPCAGLIFDGAGNLYGTTRDGGVHGDGVVFKLTPKTDGTWKETVLYFFLGVDGASSQSDVVFVRGRESLWHDGLWRCSWRWHRLKLTPNSSGRWRGERASQLHLWKGRRRTRCGFGPRQSGKSLRHYLPWRRPWTGCRFRAYPNADGSWAETVLHAFTGGKDGSFPLDKFIFDVDGNLYGTASSGGTSGYGVAFKLTPTRPANGRRRCFTPSPTSRGPSPMLA